MSKPVLIGLNNPYSSNPEHVLAPFPERSSGWRLAMMAKEYCGLDFVSYLYGFDRINLLAATELKGQWRNRAKIEARHILPWLKGRHAILLGHDVREAFNSRLSTPIERTLIHPQVVDGVTWRWLPHPSGRVICYNDPTMRMLVGMLLTELAKPELITAQEKSK